MKQTNSWDRQAINHVSLEILLKQNGGGSNCSEDMTVWVWPRVQVRWDNPSGVSSPTIAVPCAVRCLHAQDAAGRAGTESWAVPALTQWQVSLLLWCSYAAWLPGFLCFHLLNCHPINPKGCTPSENLLLFQSFLLPGPVTCRPILHTWASLNCLSVPDSVSPSCRIHRLSPLAVQHAPSAANSKRNEESKKKPRVFQPGFK